MNVSLPARLEKEKKQERKADLDELLMHRLSRAGGKTVSTSEAKNRIFESLQASRQNQQ
jgi:hypothetical protein